MNNDNEILSNYIGNTMKGIKSVFAAFLLLLASNILAQPLNIAMKLLEMKQYNRAKSAFLVNVKTSNLALDWFYLGKVYSIQGQTDSAKISFSKIAVSDPKSALASVGQAITEVAAGNSNQALIILDKAQKIAASAKDVNSLIEIALVRYQAGDAEGWINPLNLASEMDSKNPKPYIMAGEIYQMLSERNKMLPQLIGLASGRYEQALYNDPGNLEARTRVAELLVTGRNYTEAEEYLNIVIAKDSNYIPALKIYGELAYTLGKYEKASLFYGRYMALSEYSDKDLSRYITILYFNKEYAKANEFITPVLAKEPLNAVMLRLKGYTSFEMGKYPEGLDAMKKFFDLRATADTNKIIASDYEYAGKLYSRNGNDSLSIIYLSKSVDMDSSKTGLIEDISKLFEKQKKYLQAIEYYHKFIVAKNGNVASAIYFSIGKDLLMLANDAATTSDSLNRPLYLHEADTAFSKVIELSPNSHLGYQWRARVTAALDPETVQGLAKTDYEKTISILEQKTDKEKYKSDLIEGYRYMGYYTYLQFETAKKDKDNNAMEQSKTSSLTYWQKVLDFEPENEIAKQAIKALK
jgi:tetratricopeptide (TPR) repeat protein